MLGVRPRGRTVPLAVKVGAILRPPGGLGLGRTRPGRASRDPPICRRNPRRRSFPAISPASSCTTSGLRGTRRRASRAATVVPVGRSRASARAQRGKNCGNGAGDAPYPATGFDSSSPPPIGSWESLVDVVAGSSPVGGTRSYCIPNRAGESQFPSVSPPEPTIGLSPRVRGNPLLPGNIVLRSGSIPACAGEPSACCFNGRSPRVYPRVCGGTDLAGLYVHLGVGLSPRVRGNRSTDGSTSRRNGSIPACAGEPAVPTE